MSPKKIRVTCDTKLTVPLDELHGIQGNLKTVSVDSYNRFRKLVLERGINFSLHVWKELDGTKKKPIVKWWIIDGHLRKQLLTRMREDDGYEIPALPCVEIEATSLQDAKRQVLAASSSFHKTTKDGLYEFMNDAGLVFEDLGAFELPDIDLPEFKMEFFEEPAPAVEESGEKQSVTFDAYKNAAVKQVVLYYAQSEYEQIIKALDLVMEREGLDDYSQAVWRLASAHLST